MQPDFCAGKLTFIFEINYNLAESFNEASTILSQRLDVEFNSIDLSYLHVQWIEHRWHSVAYWILIVFQDNHTLFQISCTKQRRIAKLAEISWNLLKDAVSN